MIITDTRKTERAVIEIYYSSKKSNAVNEKEKAKFIIKIIKKCFQIIGIFTKENHVKNVEQLYFSDRNILTLGVERMADKMYLHKNTLYFYRKKYCMVIDAILLLFDKNNFYITA